MSASPLPPLWVAREGATGGCERLRARKPPASLLHMRPCEYAQERTRELQRSCEWVLASGLHLVLATDLHFLPAMLLRSRVSGVMQAFRILAKCQSFAFPVSGAGAVCVVSLQWIRFTLKVYSLRKYTVRKSLFLVS